MALTLNHNIGEKVIHITGTTAIPQVIFADRKFIKRVIWYKATAAADDLYIIDGNGKTWCAFSTEVNNQSKNIELGHYINGMTITVMDSGELFIYYG